VAVKRRLEDILQALLAPIRERRTALAQDPAYVHEVLRTSTRRARELTQETLDELRAALGLFALA
jgi:tryptophanyl-tRNA synthetase